jgi:hypothetical protein
MLTTLTDSQRGADLMVQYEEERDANIVRMRRIGHCDWDLITNEMVWSPGVDSIFGRIRMTGTPTLFFGSWNGSILMIVYPPKI